jgi:hypothetical protein
MPTKTQKKPPPEQTSRARTVLEHTESSAKNFIAAFDTVRGASGSSLRRAPTDEEQDLLRAALVFSAAGLDSTVKQLIRSCLRDLTVSDSAVQRGFQTYAERQLRGDSDVSEPVGGHRFLARLLVAPSPQDRLIEEYIEALTGTSLQSADQLFKVARALGVNPHNLPVQKEDLEKIFDVRNKIIHELDVKFGARVGQRRRNSRTRGILEDYSSKLIQVSKHMIEAVENKLTGPS